MDVKIAFLNGFNMEEIYVQQPPGSKDNLYLDYVFKLQKALYELKQTLRVWYVCWSKFLIKKGFRRGKVDTTLFIKEKGKEILLV